MNPNFWTVDNTLQSLDGHNVFVQHNANLPNSGHTKFRVEGVYHHQPKGGSFARVGTTTQFKIDDVLGVMIHAVEGDIPSIEIVLQPEYE